VTTTTTTRDKVFIGLALMAVYVIWGSTYYAMRVALRLLPPFLMAGPRFLIAGLILLVALRMRGATMPTAKEWRGASIVGVLLLVFGNGLVAIAQRTVDSGVAATVVATMPLWIVAMGTAIGDRPTIREALGLLAGFVGIVILRGGGDLTFHNINSIVLLFAPISWAFGSLLSRKIEMPKGPMTTAAQMIAGGSVMIVIAIVRGERPVADPTPETVFALAYLVLFGSIIAFSAYGYLLRKTRAAVATSYAYVNPLVALALGSALGGESFTITKLGACLITIAGVSIASTTQKKTPAKA
jgi:drug/metabolite transporter (DMT)-like permease